MTIGRSLPLDLAGSVTQVTIANPEVADVVIISERSVIINAKGIGFTDVILSGTTIGRRHLRVGVFAATDRRQIALTVRFAEMRRDALVQLGVGGAYEKAKGTASASLGARETSSRFLSGVSTFGTADLSAFIDAEQQSGRARSLAEPTLTAGSKDTASFLAGGEIPVPVVQGAGAQNMNAAVTIQYRPYGVQLRFVGEVITDSLIKLRVVPEVSSLDFANSAVIAGFRIPSLRTRRVETTLDVRPGESLVISGLFNDERESVRTGVPGLMNLPILGALFSSNRWQQSESELLVVVTPELFDANTPRPVQRLQFKPDTLLPAADVIKKRRPDR
jgi:pilus assembly protein CpaC